MFTLEFKMVSKISFFLTLLIFISGIAWVTCEEKCGTETCSEKECCVQLKNRLSCRPFQKENEPCGYPFTCSCEPGLICEEQVFTSKCRLARNMTDIPDKIFIEIDTEFLSSIEGSDAPENLSSTEYVDGAEKNKEAPAANPKTDEGKGGNNSEEEESSKLIYIHG
ncbi:uncharacterized protein LOC118181947 isoform X1 [Stegodyphus dumicola]|uniref:uncharacterized protein LOC118181947 isoform X1 n=1 Tax=Stegodyphus dumicola TaxID=202533 RepID=UPI0015AFDB51|nr:uncharacterized protein LOC118181947 isoform X1 [Stegodyphus dumicola]